MDSSLKGRKVARIVGVTAFLSINLLGYFCIWVFSDKLGVLLSFFLVLTWVFVSRFIVLTLFAAVNAFARKEKGVRDN